MVREPGAGSSADRRAGVNADPSSALVERPTIPVERYAQRLADAARAAADRGVSAVLIGVGADLRWTIGYAALPLERLTMLILPASGRPTLVVPRLEALPARAAPAVGGGLVDLVTWLETEDPIAIVARRRRAGGPGRRLRPALGDVPVATPGRAADHALRARVPGPARPAHRQGRRRGRAPAAGRQRGRPRHRPDGCRSARRPDRARRRS